LPDYQKGEVEIARLSLASVTGDVISVRAARRGKKITYRIVDEYESSFELQRKVSVQPLTMGEMVDLIAGAVVEGLSEFPGGLPNAYRDYNLAVDDSQDLRDLRDFVTVTSSFYPELRRWYEEDAEEWCVEAESRRKRESE
jgi:hypothetical protein